MLPLECLFAGLSDPGARRVDRSINATCKTCVRDPVRRLSQTSRVVGHRAAKWPRFPQCACVIAHERVGECNISRGLYQQNPPLSLTPILEIYPSPYNPKNPTNLNPKPTPILNVTVIRTLA